MWGRHRKRSARLPKQLALGLLEDAMGRAEQAGPEQAGPEQAGPEQAGPGQQDGPEQQKCYPDVAVPPRAVPPARSCLEPADLPADTSAGPVAGDAVPGQRHGGAERTGKSTRHGSLG